MTKFKWSFCMEAELAAIGLTKLAFLRFRRCCGLRALSQVVCEFIIPSNFDKTSKFDKSR